MKIVKVINGEKHEFNIITKHNDLQERDSYGCHPISAIRKLPEKITALQEKDASLETQITALQEKEIIDVTARADVAEAKQSIGNVETNAKNINLSETNGELKFTNYEGKSSTFRSGNEVDNSTIELVNNKISLKKVFTTEDLNGDGTETNPLNLVNKPDGYTLVTRDNKLEVAGLRSASGLVTAKYISDITLDLQEQITKNEEDIEKINVENDTQNNKIYSLETITKGLGGYLNSYDFGLNPTQEELTQYAITDTGVKNRNEIFNGTKVINTFNKHVWVLTNTPNSTPAIFNWEDLGKVQDISIATDSTFGLVKSSTNEFEGEINTLGHISINGLEEELNDIKSGYVTKEELEDKNYLTEIPSTYVTDVKLNNSLSSYYTKSESYNKSEIDDLIDNIPQGGNTDLSDYYTKEEVDNLIPEQPNLDNYYTKNDTYSKSEVDNLIPEPANLSNYYNKEETYSKSEVNTLINGIDLNDYATKSEISNLVDTTTDQLIKGEKTFTQTPQVRFGGPRLPDEYQEVEFLKSTGTQYINTGIKSSSNIEFEIDFAMSSVAYSGYTHVFGANNYESEYLNIRNALRIDGGTRDGINSKFSYISTMHNINVSKNVRTKLSFLNKILYKNGSQLKNLSSTSTFTTNYYLYVFGIYQKDSVIHNGNTTVYSLKLYDNHILVRDYVPCYRIADNVSGLYDLVENKFYTNDGTGEFERGLNVAPPEMYYYEVALKSDLENKQTKLTPGDNITISDDGVISSVTDLSDYYTKEQVDNLIPEPTDLSDYYTKSQVYTKEEVNDIIPEPISLSNYYTKAEVDNLIPSQTQVEVINKVDTLPEASETSSDLVQVDENLYYKKVSESTQSVGNITDLTRTTWRLNDTVFLEEGNPPTSQIDFTVSGLDYNFKYIGIYKFTGPDDETVCELHYAENTSISAGLMVCSQTNFEFDSWQSESYRTITITGGTDTTKAELIAWLEANATLQQSEQTITYEYTQIATNKNLDTKQDNLIAGNGISIVNNVISATSSGSSGSSGLQLYLHEIYPNGATPSTSNPWFKFLSDNNNTMQYNEIDPGFGFVQYQSNIFIPLNNTSNGFQLTSFCSNNGNRLFYNYQNNLQDLEITSLIDVVTKL